MKRYWMTFLLTVMVVAAHAEIAVFQVVSKETNRPLPGIRGDVLDADSVLLSTSFSDATGYLKFEDLKKDCAYIFSIVREGKPEYTVKLSRLSGDYDGGTIPLSDIHQLDEVVVEAKTFKEDARMMVTIPTKKDIEKSMTPIDLLGNLHLPGLNVNIAEQTVSCYGRSVVFKVNGAPKSVDYVRALNPAKILKIEYQDNPTERYLGSGTVGGIINIVLKNRLDGGSLFLYGSLCPWMPVSFTNANVAGSYNYGKSQFELQYYNDTRDYNQVTYDYERTYIGPSDGFLLNEKVKSDNSLMRYITNTASASYTYFDKKKGFMGVATLSTNFFKDHRTQNGWLTVNDAEPYYRHQDAQNNRKTPSLDLYVSKEWAGKKKLEAQVVFSYSDLGYTRDFREDVPENPYTSFTTTSNRFYGLVSELNYSMPIGNTMFSAGLQESCSYARNVYNENQTARLNQNGTSLNASLYWQKKRFSAYLMGSGNYTHVDDRYHPENYWRGIGALQLNYTLPKGMNLNFYGSYAPVTPTLSQLTTIEVDNNQNLTATGNPNLKMAHPMSGRLRFGYYDKRYMAFLTFQDNFTKNEIVSTYRYCGNGKFLSTFENFDYCNNISANINFTWKQLFNHFDVNVYGGYQYARASREGYHHSMGAWVCGGSVTGSFGAWTVYAYAQTPSFSMTPYRKSESNPENGISVMYRWRNFQFAASAYTLFNKYDAWYFEYWVTNPLMKEHFLQRMPQSFWMAALKVTYNINFGKSFQKSNKGLNNTINDNSVLKAN